MSSNPLILGTANLGLGEAGRAGAFDLLDAWVDLGGRDIDTAAVYSDWVPGEGGRSETIIGEWLAARGNRNSLRLVTKGAHPPLDDPGHARCDAASIRHDVEQSLRRLGTDRIDLWLLHRDDPTIPAVEILETLHRLVAAGKLLAIGCSNWTLPRIREAERTGGFSANQVLGNALVRLMNPPPDPTNLRLDPPMFHHAVNNDIELQLYTSQCQGLFAKRASGRPVPANYDNPACAAAAGRLEELARSAGLDPSHLALAFLCALSPMVRPIVGPRDAAQLREVHAAGDLQLAPELVDAIAEVVGMRGYRTERSAVNDWRN